MRLMRAVYEKAADPTRMQIAHPVRHPVLLDHGFDGYRWRRNVGSCRGKGNQHIHVTTVRRLVANTDDTPQPRCFFQSRYRLRKGLQCRLKPRNCALGHLLNSDLPHGPDAHAASTKVCMTVLVPAFSKSMVSRSPSTADTAP